MRLTHPLISRAARVAVVVAMAVGATFPARLDAQSVAPAGTAVLAGRVTDTSGQALAGVEVRLAGPNAQHTTTQANGVFSFTGVAPGIYQLTAQKPSFNTLTRTDVTVVANTAVNVDLALAPLSFTSLQTIGSTSASSGPGTAQINTSPAAIVTVSAQTLADQNAHQVTQVLNEIPGIITTPSANSTNISGGILSTNQVPQIRGALPYETESLIDGHPVSVGYLGYFAPLFINPNQLQSVEVVKGPGATPPDINYAIGGSVNYVTLMPTIKPHLSLDFDVDSYGGTATNIRATGTVDHGKLGYAFAYGIDGTPGPLNNYAAAGGPTLVVAGSQATINGVPFCGTFAAGTGCYQTQGPNPPNVVGDGTFQIPLYACCDALNSQYLARSELAKIRYSLSDQTSFTIAYLGGQSFANYTQTFSYPGITFQPPAGYAGSVPAGTPIPLAFNTWFPFFLQTTQGLLESELRTGIGNNTLLFRYYSGANDSDVLGIGFGETYTISANVSGGLPNANGGTTFYNDTPATIQVQGAGQFNPTQDHFDGISGEFDIPSGDNLYSLSFDRTRHNSYAASLYEESDADTTEIPAGSSQAFETYMARGQFALSSKATLNIANYFIDYHTHYTPDGGATWADAENSYYAPRLSFTDRFSRNSILRFSAGSSIAPPYLALVTTQGGAPQGNVQGNPEYYTVVTNTGKITPESAFGYDLGFDQRLSRDTLLSGDVYLTNLHGQFLTSTTSDGTYTATSGANAGATAPLFVEQTQNLGSSRYEGIELALHRSPALGLGYRVQGSMLRAYTYNLPPGFYDTAAGPNTTNLAVIPNINFQPNGLTFNGLSNGRIPYSTGYAEMNYRLKHAYFLLGATYYGSNNPYNEPAFAIVNATARYDIARNTSLQVVVNNATSAYSSTFGSLQGGIPVPLVNGKFGATPGVTIGPSNFRFSLRHDFGN